MNDPNKQLLEALRRLAMPADDQIAYLQDLGVAPSADELALEFDDSMLNVSSDAQECVKALSDYLQSISGPEHASLWSFDALRGSTRWSEVREIAAQALEVIECSDRPVRGLSS